MLVVITSLFVLGNLFLMYPMLRKLIEYSHLPIIMCISGAYGYLVFGILILTYPNMVYFFIPCAILTIMFALETCYNESLTYFLHDIGILHD